MATINAGDVSRQQPTRSETPSDHREGLGTLSLWWLRQANRRPLVAYVLAGLLAFVLLWTGARAARIETDGLLPGLVLTGFGGLLSATIPVLVTMILLFRTVRPIITIAGDPSSKESAPGIPFVRETLGQMESQWRDLRSDGALLERYSVAQWVRRCFQTAHGQYVGTDSHVPSEYSEIYSDYLDAHLDYLRRLKEEGLPDPRSERILTNETHRLRTDQSEHRTEFNNFQVWHNNNKVFLGYLAPHKKQEIIDSLKHPEKDTLRGVDIGFWQDDFALLFKAQEPSSDGRQLVHLRLVTPGEPLYEAVKLYVAKLLQVRSNLSDELPFYSPELSKSWVRFADPDVRLKKTGIFLTTCLDKRFLKAGTTRRDIRILDAAAGIGIEALYLRQADYFVVLNEIELALRRQALDYARSCGTTIPSGLFSSANWLTLTNDFDPETFHAVTVLGNSLCHLENKGQVEIAIANFFKVLVPGGVLICDERNFEYMRDNWSSGDRIKGDPFNNFRFNKSKDRVMYPGNAVMAAPVELSDRRVEFHYHEVERRDGRIVPGRRVGELSMLLFKQGDLLGSLRSKGFEKIEIFGNLSPVNRIGDTAECDFITYVATKPGGGGGATR